MAHGVHGLVTESLGMLVAAFVGFFAVRLRGADVKGVAAEAAGAEVKGGVVERGGEVGGGGRAGGRGAEL